MAAGALQYPRKKFLAALSTGRAIRYFGLAYLARVYGRVIIHWFSRYYKPVLYGLIALAGIGIVIVILYIRRVRSKRSREKKHDSKPAHTISG
jgi:membrane protein DedA with SNARE-associated domain